MAPERKHQSLVKTVWANLPKEIWCIIFSSLPKESRKNATRTCKLWLEIIRGDSRFSGNITIPWIEFELELKNSSFDWDNWPSLKTLTITDSDDSEFLSPKMALDAMKAIDFKNCPSLEKVTIDVEFELAELSQEIMEEIGTVLALTFNPKLDIDLFKLEHLDELEIEMMSQGSDDIERNLKIMKMIGEEAKNIRSLIVGGESFYYPQFFETGFKNFGASLKVLTLQNGCFDHCDDVEFYDNQATLYDRHLYETNFINSVGTFFKSLMENCPNLIKLNLGSQGDGDIVHFSYKNLFSMAGFEMVKELNVDFTDFTEADGHFSWFLGLINDCNNIETLRLNGPEIAPECLSGSMKAMIEKFKNLKKCEISFQETFFQYHGDESWVNPSYDGYTGVVLHTAEIVKELEETFADRSTEFKVLIMANTEEEKGFQIIKMPFQNSVVTRLE